MDEYKEYFDKKFAEMEESNKKRDQEMEENNKQRNEVLVEKVNKFTAGIKKLAARQDKLKEENENLRFELQRLRNEFNYAQGKETAANLIFRNLESKDDLEESLRNRILELLKSFKVAIECENIISAKREGKHNPESARIRPIKVRLSEPSLKKLIFPVSKQIRLRHGISIDNDYSPPQREELFQARSARRSLIQKGIDCTVKGFNVWINGTPYNWQAALRFGQKAITQSQDLVQPLEDDGNMSDASNHSIKRKADNISPQGRQRTRQQKMVKRDFIQRPRLSQSSQHLSSNTRDGIDYTEIFDRL